MNVLELRNKIIAACPGAIVTNVTLRLSDPITAQDGAQEHGMEIIIQADVYKPEFDQWIARDEYGEIVPPTPVARTIRFGQAMNLDEYVVRQARPGTLESYYQKAEETLLRKIEAETGRDTFDGKVEGRIVE